MSAIRIRLTVKELVLLFTSIFVFVISGILMYFGYVSLSVQLSPWKPLIEVVLGASEGIHWQIYVSTGIALSMYPIAVCVMFLKKHHDILRAISLVMLVSILAFYVVVSIMIIMELMRAH